MIIMYEWIFTWKTRFIYELRSNNREKSYRWTHFSFRSDISITQKKKKEIMLSKDHLDNSIGYRDIYIRNFHSN